MSRERRAVLRLTGVDFEFAGEGRDRRVLAAVDVIVAEGEIWSIIGRSGVGKTTLLRIMAGQLKPTAGRVDRVPDRIDRMFALYHPQRALLLPWASVSENARLGLRFTGLPPTMATDVLLEKLALARLQGRPPARLSGGQVERVALARTVLTPAAVYLLDEPLSGTDYPRRLEVEDFLDAFIEERNAAAVIVTHDVPQALAVSDRIALLQQFGAAGARAVEIEVPESLRGLPPSARRASREFGPFVQTLVASLGEN